MMIRALVSLLLALSFCTTSAGRRRPSLYDQAQAPVDKHDYKGAIALLDRVLESDPKNSNALVLLGDAKDDIGDTAGAMADYNAAIALNPQFAYA